ncbi:uncharacterized protein EV422DRAFT_255584 [Fimicolochytrium jonesii]|uniref:uncharacterized protein n=1 Tax=Fimicolochytrium jonesii TaxID=1396493 RepID=UPI0022FE74D4|nr:uncharacterized protein EV422DRAFT_255584 [Fimicolochytrium jonesii]KAI8817136.1 hypothetical protein EV422DRAFT_255584 [Fimicolochytrium jonesii]
MTIYESPFPAIPIPVTDTYTYLFGRDDAYNPSQEGNDAVVLIDSVTGATLTFDALRSAVRALAGGLLGNVRVKKGDVVAVFAPNDMDYSVAVFGTIRAGCAVTLINPSYTADEVAYQLKDSGAVALITIASHVPIALEAAKKVNIPQSRVFTLGVEKSSQLKSIRDISTTDYKLPSQLLTDEEVRTTPAYLCYSSGTSGRSKGVQTTHYNMVANVAQITSVSSDLAYVIPNEHNAWTGVLPFYHIYGLNLSLHTALSLRIPVVVFAKFDLLEFLSALQKYKVTMAHIVPPIMIGLAKHPAVAKFDITSLRFLMSGAAPLDAETCVAVTHRLKGRTAVLQGYGMTEMSPVSHITADPSCPPGSTGSLLPNAQARLVDPDTKKDVATGEPGELWIRGPMVMKGYHNNAEATAETIDADGWLHTGDIAQVDAKGFFYIVDRLKELIKYKGFQVPPAELEGYLLAHPDVADAAVIGRPSLEAGEIPRAYIVLKEGHKGVTEADIVGYIEKKVAQHKRLRGGVEFIDAIPKAASGKILRRVLREMDKEKVAREAAAATKAKL